MVIHLPLQVPIGLYFFAHAYFMFYHTFTNVRVEGAPFTLNSITVNLQLILRRFWTSKFWQGLPNYGRKLASAAIVLALAVFTAFMETWTISSVSRDDAGRKPFRYINFGYSFPIIHSLIATSPTQWALFSMVFTSLCPSRCTTGWLTESVCCKSKC